MEEARPIRIDRPESNQSALDDAVTSAREGFQTDLRDALQTEVDRFCGGLSVTVANLIVSARTKCDAGLTLLRKARRKRYLIAFAITALVYICASFVYHHSRYPAPTSLWGEVMVDVGSGLLLGSNGGSWSSKLEKTLPSCSLKLARRYTSSSRTTSGSR